MKVGIIMNSEEGRISELVGVPYYKGNDMVIDMLEKTKALVYTTIEAYPLEPSIKSNYDVISDDPELYNQIAGIENAVPYVLRWVLESENGDDGKGVLAVAIANKLL